MGFKEEHTLEQRKAESARVRAKFGTRAAVIVEPGPGAEALLLPASAAAEARKRKYLVPRDLTLGQFVYTLRVRMRLPPEKALFLYVGSASELPPTSELMGALDSRLRDPDGFLYITYMSENTFG